MTIVKENANVILKDYIETHGLKQNYVAEKMGMTPSNFNKRITGRLKFTADFALKVAAALNIKPNIFLNKSYPKRIK